MTPIWVFAAYPLLIVAPLASSVINAISSNDPSLGPSTMTIAAAAIELQGVGFLVSCVIYCAFINRLMTHGLPSSQAGPAMFVTVGPVGFTATGLIQLGTLAPKVVGERSIIELGDSTMVAVVMQVVAYTAGLCLWGLTIWFFVLSVGGQWRLFSRETRFDISFFAFVFPTSALVSSTHAVGKAFGSHQLQVIGYVFSVMLVLAYLTIVGKTMVAVYKKKLLWPAKDFNAVR